MKGQDEIHILKEEAAFCAGQLSSELKRIAHSRSFDPVEFTYWVGVKLSGGGERPTDPVQEVRVSSLKRTAASSLEGDGKPRRSKRRAVHKARTKGPEAASRKVRSDLGKPQNWYWKLSAKKRTALNKKRGQASTAARKASAT